MTQAGDLDEEDLIAEEDILVTMTHQGYIKRLPVDTYRAQRRGGRGITALNTRAEDFVEQLFMASTHSYVLFSPIKAECIVCAGMKYLRRAATPAGLR